MALYTTGMTVLSPPPRPTMTIMQPARQEIVSVLTHGPPMLQATMSMPIASPMPPMTPVVYPSNQSQTVNVPPYEQHPQQNTTWQGNQTSWPKESSGMKERGTPRSATAAEPKNPPPAVVEKKASSGLNLMPLYAALCLLCLMVFPAFVMAAYAVDQICAGSDCFLFGGGPAVLTPGAAWAYGDQAAWGGTCASGQNQSPIDITGSVPAALSSTYTKISQNNFRAVGINDFKDVAYVGFGDGAVEIVDADIFLRWGGVSWKLERMTFHTPSEHTIGGTRFDAELQWRMRSVTGEYLVLALVGKVGDRSPEFFSQVLALAGSGSRQRFELDLVLALNRMGIVSSSVGYYGYVGSLTTPPCTEGTQWIVMQLPFSITRSDLNRLQELQGDNARELQGGNGRPVYSVDLNLAV